MGKKISIMVACLALIPASPAALAQNERAYSDSRLFEFGVSRVQRFDRDVKRATDGEDLPAFSNQGFVYLRSDTMSLFPFDNPQGCGRRGDLGGPGGRKPRKCDERWTIEFEGGADFGLDSDDSSSLWFGANFYRPLKATALKTGIFTPYDTYGLAMGVSAFGRVNDSDDDSNEDLEITPFVRLDCTTEKLVVCNGGKRSSTSLTLEAGWSPQIVSSDDDAEHRRWYLAIENVVLSGMASDVDLRYEATARANYDNYYDFDDSSLDTDVGSIEFGINLAFLTDKLRGSSLNLDLTAGYREIDGERFRGSSFFLTPSLYFQYAFEGGRPEPGGSNRYFRRGQNFRYLPRP